MSEPLGPSLVEFVARLRASGVRISQAESMAAVEGLAALDAVADRPAVRDALRALLVKDVRDMPTYDALFDRYFAAYTGLGADGERDALAERLGGIEGRPGELAGRLRELMDPAALDVRLQDLEEEVGLDKIQNRLQVSYFTRRMLERLGLEAGDPMFEELASALATGGGSQEAVEMARALERFRAELRDLARRRVERRLGQVTARPNRDRDREALAERSFFSLSAAELREMNDVVARLARKLRTVLALRRRRARRGGLDAQKTLRRNIQHGGVPVELVFRRKRLEKPDIVNLCDVSGSVRHIAHFMLQFIYSIQDQFSRVRSFVFVRDLTEVTDWFKGRDVEEAVREVLASDRIDYYNNSDFGHVFDEFRAEHLGEVTRRTTVLVLGDARSNYHEPRADAVAAIRERAKRVIWLNPESRLTWGFGDSVMHDYAPHCDHVREVRNLNQLVRAVEELVL